MRDRARVALLLLAGSVSCSTSAATDASYPMRTRVLATLQESRPFDFRLTSTQAYSPCATADTAAIDKTLECSRSAHRDAITRAAALSVDVTAALAKEATTDALWSAALLDLWSPDATPAAVDRAIVRLLEVSARTRGRHSALALDDLAIAHAVRAAIRSNVGDLFAALDFAERAVAVDSTLVAARFNRAALLEHLRIDTQAAEAWRLLSSEPSDWGTEAQQRARRLVDRIAVTPASFGSMTNDDSLARRASSEPQRAREYVLDSLVGAWASASSSDRERLRHRAERIGNALVARSRDSSVAHIAAELTSEPRVAAAAATGAKGWIDYQQTRYVDAQPELETSIRELRSLNALALADWLELTLAGVHISRAEYAVAERLFDGIVARAAKRHDVALAARARWGMSLSLARRGAMVDGESAYGEAARQFDMIGEAGNSAFLKTIISEIHHALGRSDVSDRDLYDALVGFHAHPRAGQRYALMLVIGTRLSERGLRYAAAAMVREAVLEAGATGRTKDLPEALTRLATAESNLSYGANAKRTIGRARQLLAGVPDSVMRSRLDAEVARAEARVYRTDDPKMAVDRIGQAISYFAASRIPTDEATLRVDRASLLLSLGDSASAENDLASATSMAARYIGRDPSRSASRAWLATQRDAYHQLISIALAHGDTDRAYDYVLRSRTSNGLTARSRRPDLHEWPVGSALVEYVVLLHQTVVWTTNGGSKRMTIIPVGDSALADLVARFRNLIRQNDDSLAAAVLGERLNTLLITPIRASRPRRIVIVPDGPLTGLPFAALRADGGKYLIEDVSLAYSDGGGRSGGTSDTLPLADALFVGSPTWDRGMFSDLEPLPATAREIDEASALYSRRTVLIDTAPNRARVLRELSRHDVVHFAAHARIVNDNPGASHLVLAKQPGGFAKNVLFASEIAAMRLNRVQLLILSACGSPGAAFSHVTSNGLAEAFLDAGVRQVIANDWEADDEATAVLSTKLHRELRSGLASDDALRRAQVALLRGGSKRLASPSVWSGFRLIVAAW